MAALNYAQKWEPGLIKTFIDGSYIAPFVATDVNFIGAKTFHFTTLNTSGYKAHSLAGGWQRGTYNQKDHPYTLEHDRDVEFFIDKRDVDETNKTASIQNISAQFQRTQATPEMDAQFFSKIAAEAAKVSMVSSTAIANWDKTNALKKLKEIIGKVRRYRSEGLVLYVRPEIMDALSLDETFKRNIQADTIVADGKALQTRITNIDGTPVIEVIHVERFYTAFNFTEGFKPQASTSYPINVLAATPATAKFVPKISSIFFFEPGQHTEGDGYLYQNRAFWDTFVFPNGLDGKVDSVFVDKDTQAFAG